MKEHDIIQKIREELKQCADQNYKEQVKKYVKDEITHYGVKTPVTRKLSSKYYKKVKKKSKKEIFSLGELLLQSGSSEERTIAFDWAFRLKRQYVLADFDRFESWLKRYVTGWGSCDDLCTHALGAFVYQFPEIIPKVKVWTTSENCWLRRASAVVFIYAIRRDTYIDDGFKIADLLLQDTDDMVQKGYGWMLKEISNAYPQKVFTYVMAHKDKMPRTSLRYAIEKLSPDLRKKAMAKDNYSDPL